VSSFTDFFYINLGVIRRLWVLAMVISWMILRKTEVGTFAACALDLAPKLCTSKYNGPVSARTFPHICD
jgi:hypothetical protein